MNEGLRPETVGESPFEGIDPKLNVFALANGMDLAKSEIDRRLVWFAEGLERAIQIEEDESGGFVIAVFAWKTGSAEIDRRASVGGGLSESDLMGILQSAIETANGL